MCTPTPSHCQKAIKKLNNIVITQLTRYRLPNIPSNSWRFNTFANWKMLKEEFKMWPVDLLPDAILITVGIYIINLGYLEDKFPCFIEFSDGNIDKLNRMLVGLDTTAIIPETDN